MIELIQTIISGSKWFVLLPVRVIIAILNLIPTPIKTYMIIHYQKYDQIQASYQAQSDIPVRLGHLIIAWIRGDFHKTLISKFKVIISEETEMFDDDDEMVEDGKIQIWGISVEDLNKIKSDCKIF